MMTKPRTLCWRTSREYQVGFWVRGAQRTAWHLRSGNAGRTEAAADCFWRRRRHGPCAQQSRIFPNSVYLVGANGVICEEAGINQHDARELFRRMVFNILVDNTDDHEKNHALLVANPFDFGRLKLAPAYDILPTNSGLGF